MPWFDETKDSLTLNIRVIPRAAKDSIQGLLADALKIRIQAPPVDGKANTYLIRFLSKTWSIPRSNIVIVSGETGRNKRVKILKPSAELRKELLSFGDK